MQVWCFLDWLVLVGRQSGHSGCRAAYRVAMGLATCIPCIRRMVRSLHPPLVSNLETM